MIYACHIIPFAESYNDRITNGIALCPNLHRAFDRGLIGINKNYKVTVSNLFIEDKSKYSIKVFDRMTIILPTNRTHYPNISNIENLTWHQKNTFKH